MQLQKELGNLLARIGNFFISSLVITQLQTSSAIFFSFFFFFPFMHSFFFSHNIKPTSVTTKCKNKNNKTVCGTIYINDDNNKNFQYRDRDLCGTKDINGDNNKIFQYNNRDFKKAESLISSDTKNISQHLVLDQCQVTQFN